MANSQYSDFMQELVRKRELVKDDIEQRDEALGPDSADVPFAELLREAARRIVEIGDGPLADRLLRKAEQVEAALARAEGRSDG